MFIVSSFTLIYKGGLYIQRWAIQGAMTKCLIKEKENRNNKKGEKSKNQVTVMHQERRFRRFCYFPWHGEGLGKIRVFSKEEGKSISKNNLPGKTFIIR